jgi:hypothetical protein
MFKNTDPEFRRPPQELVILFQRLQLHCIPGIDGDVSTVELDVLSILPHPAKDCVLSLENDVQHFGAALRSFPSDPGIPMTESVDLPHFAVLTRIENETRQGSVASDGCPALSVTPRLRGNRKGMSRHGVPAACALTPNRHPTRAPILHLVAFLGSHLPISCCILTHHGNIHFLASSGPPKGPPSSLLETSLNSALRVFTQLRSFLRVLYVVK